jgi:transposase
MVGLIIICCKGVLKRMIWPPQSPDLNPIEQVWDFVKSRLEESNKYNLNNNIK